MSVTAKISVSIGREQLRQAKELAGRLGLSLSTFVSDALRLKVEAQARKQAGLEVLATFRPQELPSDGEMQALLRGFAHSPGAGRAKAASSSKASPKPGARRRAG